MISPMAIHSFCHSSRGEESVESPAAMPRSNTCGSRPAGGLLSCRDKKVAKETLPCRSSRTNRAIPCAPRPAGRSPNSPSAEQRASGSTPARDISLAVLRCSASSKGDLNIPHSQSVPLTLGPVVAVEHSRQENRSERALCLSEAVLFTASELASEPDFPEKRRGCRRLRAAFSFGYFSLGCAREKYRARGARTANIAVKSSPQAIRELNKATATGAETP